jgi:hypothetical protein
VTRPGRPSRGMPRIWVVAFVVVLVIAALLFFLMKAARTPVSRMSFLEGDDIPGSGLLPPSPGPRRVGTLTVLDGGRKVLTYVYGDQLPPGVDPRFARSSYIHPLYGLDGRILTEDFPRDHFHHHGLFWAWPEVRVRGVDTSTWEPRGPPLRERFVKWVERNVDDTGARLVVENTWALGETVDVAEETVAIVVHGATRFGRAIDIEIALRPVGGPIALRGAQSDQKGYSGLCFRGRASEGRDIPVFKGAAMTTDQGPLGADSTGRRFRWADLSVPGLGGVAIFVSPRHPGFPPSWLIRNSYAGILNPCWPGLEEAVLAPDVPVFLRYRVYVHQGDAGSGRVAGAYEAYLAAETK